MKANLLLVHNIRALLHARRMKAGDLAFYCGHKGAWMSKILNGQRGLSIDDLDRIADFFGVTAGDLFRPGISPVLERRRQSRRKGVVERRQGERRGLQRTTLLRAMEGEDQAWSPPAGMPPKTTPEKGSDGRA